MYQEVTNNWLQGFVIKEWSTRKGSFLMTISNISKALICVFNASDHIWD
jgi:hypothetical protein